MKILFLSKHYPPFAKGGYEINCQKVVNALHSRGHETLVITSNWMAEKGTDPKNIHRLLHLYQKHNLSKSERRIAEFRQMLTSIQDYRVVQTLCKGFSPEIAYIWNMGGLSLNILEVFKKFNVPIVADLGDYWLSQILELFSEDDSRLKRKYRSLIHGGFSFDNIELNNFLCNSNTLKMHYSSISIPSENITVIPRGLESRYIANALSPLPHNHMFRLLFAGRITPEKGVHLAIDAVNILINEKNINNIHFDIIGHGDEEYVTQMKERTKSAGIEAHISIFKPIPHSEIMAAYKNYHALLLPAIWVEPFGNIVTESMSQGLCVIASNRGGPAEIIDHKKDGILVEPENPRALADAITNLIENPNLIEQLRQAALKKIKRDFHFEQVADSIETYLHSVIS